MKSEIKRDMILMSCRSVKELTDRKLYLDKIINEDKSSKLVYESFNLKANYTQKNRHN